MADSNQTDELGHGSSQSEAQPVPADQAASGIPPTPSEQQTQWVAQVSGIENEGAGLPFTSSQPPISSMTFEEFIERYPLPGEFTRKPTGESLIEPDSVFDESGRSYHGYRQGKYFLPNDAAEQDRLDVQHHMFSLLLDGKLSLAPMVVAPKFVMDVGELFYDSEGFGSPKFSISCFDF